MPHCTFDIVSDILSDSATVSKRVAVFVVPGPRHIVVFAVLGPGRVENRAWNTISLALPCSDCLTISSIQQGA